MINMTNETEIYLLQLEKIQDHPQDSIISPKFLQHFQTK